MPRSVWKGPFVDAHIYRYWIKHAKSAPGHKIKKIWSRRSTIVPAFIGRTFAVHNGKVFISVVVNESMVGLKFGEFAPTRTFRGHAGDKKVVKGKR